MPSKVYATGHQFVEHSSIKAKFDLLNINIDSIIRPPYDSFRDTQVVVKA